jgi:hypothetical protein
VITTARSPATTKRSGFEDFDVQADALAQALQTDLPWLKEHTRLTELAWRWTERNRPEEMLLRGIELDEADAWAARKPREAPLVTEQQREYLVACRAAERTPGTLIRAIFALLLAITGFQTVDTII